MMVNNLQQNTVVQDINDHNPITGLESNKILLKNQR
jgi:hypothetical protein